MQSHALGKGSNDDILSICHKGIILCFFSRNLFQSLFCIIESFHKFAMEIDLTQACVGEVNTILRGDTNWPIIYGVGVNTRSGEIFPGNSFSFFFFFFALNN
jgi:Protein N-terminal asparagine amidohydrolase